MSLGAAPAYAAATLAQRQAIAGSYTVSPAAGSGLTRAALGTEATITAFRGRMDGALPLLHNHRTPVGAAAAPMVTAPDEGSRQQRAIGSADPAQAAQQLRERTGPRR